MLHLVFWKIFGLQTRETKEWQTVWTGSRTKWGQRQLQSRKDRFLLRDFKALFLPPKRGQIRTQAPGLQ